MEELGHVVSEVEMNLKMKLKTLITEVVNHLFV